jgi:hypothetical protein
VTSRKLSKRSSYSLTNVVVARHLLSMWPEKNITNLYIISDLPLYKVRVHLKLNGAECVCVCVYVRGCCTESRNYNSVQVYTFRRYKINLWKMLAANNFPDEVFQGLCTVQAVCPQMSPAHKRKSTEYNYTVFHWLMYCTVFTMLADL